MAEPQDMRGQALYDALIAIKPGGLPETDWAEQAGVNRGFFTNLKQKNTSPRSDTLRRLLNHIGKTVADLSNPEAARIEAAPETNAAPFKMEGAGEGRMIRDLPVYGTALGADEVIDGESIEQTTLNSGDIVEYRKRPVILDGRADVYGLYVQGSSMAPRWRDGNVIFVESRKRPAIGDDAVIYLKPVGADEDERASCVLVKTLVGKSASYVELEQYTPHIIFKIATSRIGRMDRVLTLDDLTD